MQVSTLSYLRNLNRLDEALFVYAKSLAIARLFHIQSHIPSIQTSTGYFAKSKKTKFRGKPVLSQDLLGCPKPYNYDKDAKWKNKIGIYRPPYHKGPLNITMILLNITDEPPLNNSKVAKVHVNRKFINRNSYHIDHGKIRSYKKKALY